MAAYSCALQKLIEEAKLEIIYAPDNLKSVQVTSAEVNRPGLFLAGYYDYFDPQRLQVVGLAEMNYLSQFSTTARREALEKLFMTRPPALIVGRLHELELYPEMVDFAKIYNVPLLGAADTTSTLTSNLNSVLNVELAPRVTRHGVLVEVYGVGILILGDSGIGKSETAIELVKRGHRLVADDAVELRRISSHSVVGTAPSNIRHFIELRGVGIINVARVFGVGAVKLSQEVDLVVNLEEWDPTETYQRTGLESEFYDILGVQITSTTIPVHTGRNLAVILETAAMNTRQKEMGYNSAVELMKNLGLDTENLL